MNQKNPLFEAFFVNNPNNVVFHKGQVNQLSYAIKSSNRAKDSLSLRIKRIDEDLTRLMKKYQITKNSKQRKILVDEYKKLKSQKMILQKQLKVQDGISKNLTKKLKMMVSTNKKIDNLDI